MTDDAADHSALMDRREALRRASLLLGGALAAPTIAGVLGGCRGDDAGETQAGRALTAVQLAMTAAIAEHIIPATDTPGAREAGVHGFIDRMLADYYDAADRARFAAGLEDVDARARRAFGRPFLQCAADRQQALVAELDREAFARPAPAATSPATAASRQTERGVAGAPVAAQQATAQQATASPPFMRTMKELTVVGYYTSRLGATRELRHEPVPGRFDGCVPLAQVGRTWAV